MSAGAWREQGACAGRALQDATKIDQVFFPKKGRPSNNPKHRNFCGTCPVAEMCFKFAIVHDLDGVWGNTTRSQREILAQKSPDYVLGLVQEAIRDKWYEPILLPHRSSPKTVEVPLLDELVELVDRPDLDIELLGREDFLFEFEWVEYQQKIQRTAESFEEPLEG